MGLLLQSMQSRLHTLLTYIQNTHVNGALQLFLMMVMTEQLKTEIETETLKFESRDVSRDRDSSLANYISGVHTADATQLDR